jgi:sulfite reductase (NADPH) hemoprotein beta-component
LPDALADLAEVGMHAMQTSAITPATSPPTSGPAWRPARSRIPASGPSCCGSTRRCIRNSRSCRASSRFAITASAHDRAAIKVHDIGLRLHKNAEGETGFEVLVGGGLGRTPFIGKTIKPFVHGRDLLSYVEAILRVYNQYGRRDNIYKARIKILVHELGIEKFAQEVEEEWLQMRDSALTLDDAVIEEIRSRFSYPAYEKLPHMPDE